MANIDTTIVITNDTRAKKLQTYLYTILDYLLTDDNYKLNANFLSNDINNYSIDRVPTEQVVEEWIIPIKKYRDVYEFRSRNSYSEDDMENLKNIGFFEKFEDIIYSNNKNEILPEIDGIEEIKCLVCGALNIADTNTCEFSTMIQITYIKDIEESSMSI